jgi:hypothetical protein
MRPLESISCCVLGCAIFFSATGYATVKKATYIVIGIDLDGNRDILGAWVGEK